MIELTSDYLPPEPPQEVMGCTDSSAFNYNPDANTDDGSCVPVILGCIDSTATNYNPNANTDNGSCEYEEEIFGCTDPNANNYHRFATVDDGSCTYDDPGGDFGDPDKP